jgi:hypothetical protein
MKRTQIYIDEELDQKLRSTAAAEGRSAAALIREAVRAYLADRRTPSSPDPFLRLAGAFSGGPSDASTGHDGYLYGRGSKQRGS